MRNSRGAIWLSSVLLLIAVSGCCRISDKDAAGKGPVIARINDYCLTAGDLQDEAKPSAPAIRASADQQKAKENVLDEIITKKVLLQEAQKLDLDKDEPFRKEIERYWEQALLKSLMKKKIDEFSGKLPPDIKGDARQKMIQAQLTKWVADLRGSARVKIYKNNLKNVEIK